MILTQSAPPPPYIGQISPWFHKHTPGGCLNIKMSSYKYRDPHVKDKTVARPSYL